MANVINAYTREYVCAPFPKVTTGNLCGNEFTEKSAPWMKMITFGWTSQVYVPKNLEETRMDKNYANHKNYNVSNSDDFSLILMSQDPKLNKGLDLRGQSI